VLLHDELYARGLRILAFPCNQFGRQERGSPKEIRAFADGYGARFDIYAKVNVNGRSADPVFTYLKRHLSDGLGSSIKWNFTKFLVDRDGKPRRRFSPSTSPLALRADIERLLDASSAAQDAE
jgi:glutathione peroxidase-family protein